MSRSRANWKKGRGKLGILDPLIGTWRAETSSPVGPMKCVRSFSHVLGGTVVQLSARWEFGSNKYEELALFAPGEKGLLQFWSFTSDGKRSEGKITDVSDIHAEAVGFEAEMPAGLARMAYWPDEQEGFHWVVEAKTKKGWKRFTEHHYRQA